MRVDSYMLGRMVARFVGAIALGWALLLATPTKAQIVKVCAPGVELRVSAVVANQGNLVLVELRSKRTVAGVTGEWDGEKLSFWQEQRASPDRSSVRMDIWRGLLAVDLEKPPGQYELRVNAGPEGKGAECSVKVNVKKGTFATERLSVEKQFVEPNPEQVKRAQNEQQRLRELFGGVTPEKLWQGAFRVPLDGVSTGGNFGRRRILNGEPGSPHSGVDFPATAGTPVHATQRGKVALAEELFFAGNTVVLDHGLGVYSLYGHLSEISVQVGEMVDAGGVLGNVGATGRVTGPHLHWGLTVNRAKVNGLQIVELLGNRQRSKIPGNRLRNDAVKK